MEKQTVGIEIARPEGEESHMHVKVEKILNGYIVRVLLPGFEEYDEPLFLPTAGLVQTHSRAVMDAWIKGEQISAEPTASADAEKDFRHGLFKERCGRAKRIIARARADLGDDLGGSVTDLLADNMLNLSLEEIRTVMRVIGEE